MSKKAACGGGIGPCVYRPHPGGAMAVLGLLEGLARGYKKEGPATSGEGRAG